MNKTFADQLSCLFNQVVPPVKKNHYTNKELFFLKLKTKVPCGIDKECEDYMETIREPDNWLYSNNGGDYWLGNEYIDRFCASRSSCEMSPEDDFLGGYIREVPVVISIPYFYGNPRVYVRFMDGDYYEISAHEWKKIESEFRCVVRGSWGVRFR